MKSRKLYVLMKPYIYGKVYFYYKLSCFAADIQKKSVRLYSTTEQVSTFFSRNFANFFEIG